MSAEHGRITLQHRPECNLSDDEIDALLGALGLAPKARAAAPARRPVPKASATEDEPTAKRPVVKKRPVAAKKPPPRRAPPADDDE